MRQLVCILNTPVDVLDMPGVLERLEQFIREQRFHQVATANADFVINAESDAELRHILRYADLVMPDGMPLVWASRALGTALPERVTGADIVPALAALAAQKGYRIYMIGAKPEVAQQAKAKLLQAHPGLQIVGCVSPPVQPLDEMDNAPLLRDIRAARPDILLVAFGNPKQEKWIYRNREALQEVSVCIGVGGTFDFLAGQTVRAPQWMQKSGLEWVFRLSQEPKRLWKRYTRDVGQFGSRFVAQWRVSRTQNAPAPARWTESRAKESVILCAEGVLDSAQQAELNARCERILNLPAHLIVDLTRVEGVDAAIMGTLLNLPRRAAQKGCEVRLVGANARVQKTLRAARSDELLTFHATPEEALTMTSLPRIADLSETQADAHKVETVAS